MKRYLVLLSALSMLVLSACNQVNDTASRLQKDAEDTYNNASTQVDNASKSLMDAKETAEQKLTEVQDAAAKVQDAADAVGKVTQ